MAQDLDYYEEKYGELITSETAARILKITKQGFDSSLYGRSPDFEKIRAIKCKVGRRVYYPTKKFFAVVFSPEE